MVPWAHPSPQCKRHLDRFSRRFAGLTTVTDRQTDKLYEARSVTIGCNYIRSTAMRRNNTAISLVNIQLRVQFNVIIF